MERRSEFARTPAKMKKKRFEHTEHAKKRREKRKKITKAGLRKGLLTHFKEALVHIETYNRAPTLDAKLLHIRKAILALDGCLEARPGNHTLRAQRTICQEELWELEKIERLDAPRSIVIILDPDWHA